MSILNPSKVAQGERVVWRRLLWVAPLAIVAASVANLIVLRTAVALFPSVGQFPMLGTAQVIASTVVYLLLATVVFVLVGKLSSRPVRQYRIVAVVALLLSFGAPLSAGAGFMPGASADAVTVITLIVMHVVAAAITVPLFTTMAVETT